MDEKIKHLRLLDAIEEQLETTDEKQIKPKLEHPNQSNPIYKNLAKFNNEKIGDKWSIKDLLR